MKNWKYQNQIGIAILIAAFGFSPMAHGDPAQAEEPVKLKKGMSLTALNSLTDQKFTAILDTDNGENILRFAGSIPASCAEGASVSSQYKDKKHLVIIRLAEKCESLDSFESLQKEKKVYLSKVLKPVTLEDKSGKVYISYATRPDADPAFKDKWHADEKDRLKDIEIIGSKQLEAQIKGEKLDQIKDDLMAHCNQGDIAGLGREIETNREFLLNVNDALKKQLNKLQLDSFKNRLAKADSAEAARTILDDFTNAAEKNSWDLSLLNPDYISRRNHLLNVKIKAASSNADINLEKIDSELEAWNTELDGLDSERAEKQKNGFKTVYKQLAQIAADRENSAEAAKFIGKAANLSNGLEADKLRGEEVSALADAYKQCVVERSAKVKANPMMRMNPYALSSAIEKAAAPCKAKYRDPAKAKGEKVVKDLQKRGKKDEEVKAIADSSASDLFSVFGSGGQWIPGMGFYAAPGSLDMFANQTMAEQMQKLMYGMPAGSQQTQASGAGSIFSSGN